MDCKDEILNSHGIAGMLQGYLDKQSLSLLGFQRNNSPSNQIHYLSATSAFSPPQRILFFHVLQANPLLKPGNENKSKPFWKHTSLTVL